MSYCGCVLCMSALLRYLRACTYIRALAHMLVVVCAHAYFGRFVVFVLILYVLHGVVVHACVSSAPQSGSVVAF